MPRPQRCRRICGEPRYCGFVPDKGENSDISEQLSQYENVVTLTLDEFETIRLVDFEKKTHEQCATQMEISRTTVTEIYESARYKIADSLVNGKRLIIAGGNYKLCDGSGMKCCGKKCMRFAEKTAGAEKIGGKIMKIAVTYENGMIFGHFGHTEQFKIYDVEDGKVVSSAVVPTMGSGHGALAGFLKANGVDTLICGGIGGGAQNALAEAGIRLFGGASGSADAAVNALLGGSLDFNPDVHCDHHDHQHSEGGEHGCGSGNCGNNGCH